MSTAISKANKAFKDYSRETVPEEKSHSWLSMGLVWSGVGISLGLLLTGGTIGDGLNIREALVAAFVGGAILTVVTSLTGIIGARLRLSTAMAARFAFGRSAIVLIAFIMALGCYGWFAVQLGLFGDTAATAWTALTGGSIGSWLFIIIGGVLMISTAVIGYKALDILSKLAVPLMTVLIIASTWRVLEANTWDEILAMEGNGEPISVGVGISLTVSSFIVGAVIAPDVSRYAKSPAHTIGGAVLAFGIVTPLVLITGTLMAMETGTSDIVNIMIGLGWGVLALVLLMLAQWSSNDNNLYSAALGLAVIFTKLQKWQLTAIAGVVGIILALMGIYQNFPAFLNVLGVCIPPVAGVIIADYYFGKRVHYGSSLVDSVPVLRPFALAAWIVGSLVALITTYTPLFITTMPVIDGMVSAGVVLFLLNRFGKDDATAPRTETEAAA
ncbi:cytosine permease [Sediminivirga luteola]|uniref:cytosine permease n=1 Tax=Sediminivirga luteola TaxID=1774748 RepID=UPI001F568639|nr:cytosine permease [Sediminivirga luteola]MCI2265101.1 cytosine permease [Sediminivirga luteola]